MNSPQEFCALTQFVETADAASALVTIVRTRGSTFRRVGARMLVTADGRVLHGLSGGCPQADLETQAREVIATQASRLVHYNRENAGDLLYEQGCGGEIEVLIQPAPASRSLLAFQQASVAVKQRIAGFFATGFERDQDSVLGVQNFCFTGGETSGDVPDQVELDQLISTFSAEGKNTHWVVDSGRKTWLIERISPCHQLLIVGDNSGARALAQLAVTLGWDVVVSNPRTDSQASSSGTMAFVTCRPTDIGEHIRFDAQTSAVVMTHSLESDIEWVSALAPHKLAYLGALGSRKRAALLHAATGLSYPALRAPAGLDIGSETPTAIALSIAADIHAVQHRRKGGSLALSSLSIHP